MPRLVGVRALENYRLAVRFDDGSAGEIDLAEFVGKGVFAQWNDPDFFLKVGIDPATGTAMWPGGIDLDLDRMYHDVTGSPLPGSLTTAR